MLTVKWVKWRAVAVAVQFLHVHVFNEVAYMCSAGIEGLIVVDLHS